MAPSEAVKLCGSSRCTVQRMRLEDRAVVRGAASVSRSVEFPTNPQSLGERISAVGPGEAVQRRQRVVVRGISLKTVPRPKHHQRTSSIEVAAESATSPASGYAAVGVGENVQRRQCVAFEGIELGRPSRDQLVTPVVRRPVEVARCVAINAPYGCAPSGPAKPCSEVSA